MAIQRILESLGISCLALYIMYNGRVSVGASLFRIRNSKAETDTPKSLTPPAVGVFDSLPIS